MSSDYVRYSVVIPCFNDGAFVPGAIASVREHDAVEIVVVDDGSTDPATLTVLDDLRGGGIRVIRQDNAGLAAARMRGVAETSAPFVLCLDSDDELAPGALGELADAIEANPGCGLRAGIARALRCPFRGADVSAVGSVAPPLRESLDGHGPVPSRGADRGRRLDAGRLLRGLGPPARTGRARQLTRDRRPRRHPLSPARHGAHEYALSRAARRGLRDPAEPSPGALRPPARSWRAVRRHLSGSGSCFPWSWAPGGSIRRRSIDRSTGFASPERPAEAGQCRGDHRGARDRRGNGKGGAGGARRTARF